MSGTEVRVKMTHRMTVEVDTPNVPARVLRDMLAQVPDDATVTVVPIMGGSQREPETTGYRFVVNLLPNGLQA